MLIFLDLETTGVSKEDKICSVGLLVEDEHQQETMYELINENKKISVEASSIHHITKEMIQSAKPFIDSQIFKFLSAHNSLENTLVVHDKEFILSMLESCGFHAKYAVVDTKRVTKHLIQECEQFSLQFLRYELQVYKHDLALKELYGIKDAIVAHHALSDAFVIKELYEYLEQNYASSDMYSLTFEQVMLEKLDFGKYKGRYISEIATDDRAYLEWVLSALEDIDVDMKYSIKKNLEGYI